MISVIVPVKNGEYCIGNLIDSILSQSYSHWELIIVDDGSTDDTLRVIREAEKDRRIKGYKNPRKGVSAARNYAMDIARGEYLVFADADDILPADSLEIRNRYMEAGYGMLLAKHNQINVQTNKIKEIKVKEVPHIYENGAEYLERAGYFESSITTGMEYVWDKAFNASIIKSRGLRFDENRTIYEDWNFVLEFVKNCHKKISVIDDVVYTYSINNSNSTSVRFYGDVFEVLKEYFERLLEAVSSEAAFEGANHGYMNKIIRELLIANRNGNPNDVENFCKDIISDDKIVRAAALYKSRNEIESDILPKIIAQKDLKEMMAYLETRR